MKNDFESQLDKIRVEIYEEIKNMPRNSVVNYINDNAKIAAEKYGFKIANSDELLTKPQKVLA